VLRVVEAEVESEVEAAERDALESRERSEPVAGPGEVLECYA